MKIFTSYFKLNGNHPKSKSIVTYTPKFFTGDVIECLSPNSILVNGVKKGFIKQETLLEIYRRDIIPKIILKDILSILKDGDILLGHAKEYDACHRKIISEYLRKHGVECEELTIRLIPSVKENADGRKAV